MNRFEPNPYARNDFSGGNDFGLFGGGYPSTPVMPPSASMQSPFAAGPPPPSLMSLSAVPPLMQHPGNVGASQLSLPAPSNLPPPTLLQPPAMGGGGAGGVAAGSAGMSSTGVNTNSRHPLAVKARVFVGNLNTNAVSRDEFEQLFRRFGEIMAVSMHRGYGFVQYGFEYEARNAINTTDGMLLGGQRLDVNLASEPKTGRDAKTIKRQLESSVPEVNIKRSRSNTDGKGQTSAAASTTPKPLFPMTPKLTQSTTNVELTTGPTSIKSSPIKSVSSSIGKANILLTKAKEHVNKVQHLSPKTIAAITKSEVANGSETNAATCVTAPGANELSPDILICGQCRSLFDNLNSFTSHRKDSGCTNSPTAGDTKATAASDKNTSAVSTPTKSIISKHEGEPETLLCFICQKPYDCAWNLIVHIGKDHSIDLYLTSKGPPADGADKVETTKEKILAAAKAKKEKEEEGKKN